MGWNNYPENWEKDAPLIEILEIDRIPKELVLGEKYHCSWAQSRGMVWVLKAVSNNQATLETPRTKRRITTHINFLRVLNKVALKNASKRIKQQEQKGEDTNGKI